MKEETRDFIDKLPTEINCMKEHPKNTSLSPSCNRNNHKDCDSDVCNCPCHLKEKENPVEESLRKTFEEATSEEEKCEHKVIEECVRDIYTFLEDTPKTTLITLLVNKLLEL